MEYKEPTITPLTGHLEGNKYNHPAFGLLRFNRTHIGGDGEELYGSSITHNNTISLEIYHSEMERTLNHDWYFDRNLILRCEMSLSQFAEAITSFGTEGVPVTLKYTEKDGRIPYCRFENKRTQFSNEFRDSMDKNTESAKELYNEMAKIFTKNSIGKKDRDEILKKFNKIIQDMGPNAVYTFEQFNKQMDKTVTEAKGEIEAFMENKIHQVASEAMLGEIKTPLMIENKEE